MDEMTVDYEALENENEKGEDSDGLSDVELQLEVTKLSDTAKKQTKRKKTQTSRTRRRNRKNAHKNKQVKPS